MQKLKDYFLKFKRILFGYHTPFCIGVDISSSAVKMVELKPNSLIIKNYQITPLEYKKVSESIINDFDAVSQAVSNTWRKFAENNYLNAAIAIPMSAVIIKKLYVDEVDEYKTYDVVKTYLTEELETEDIDFDYVVLQKINNQVELNAIVAKKEKIEEYQAIMQISNIHVAAIDIEQLALENLFSTFYKINRLSTIPGNTLFLDLGATRLRIFLFIEGSFVYTSEVKVNYYKLLINIIENSNDKQLINMFKAKGYIDLKQILKLQTAGLTLLQDSINNDIIKLTQILKSNLLIDKKIPLNQIAAIYLLGGNALIPNIAEKIQSFFGIKAILFSEVLKIDNPNILEEDLMRLSGALALATWGHNIE